MRIYLDFDDTILNTGAFKDELKRIFKSVGFTEEDFAKNWEKTKADKGDFDLDYFFDLFALSGGFDARKTWRTVNTLFSNVDVFVHDDFFDFAKEFGKDKLAMLSFGTTLFQREKIENSKIVPYFSEIIVTSRGKEEHFSDIIKEHSGKKIFFVDDRAYQIDKVKEAVPEIVAMKIERPTGRYINDKANLADHVVRDLHEVAKIIKDRM